MVKTRVNIYLSTCVRVKRDKIYNVAGIDGNYLLYIAKNNGNLTLIVFGGN